MWRFRPTRTPDHLSDYWNALNRNAPAAEIARLAALVDPSVVAAIERVRALHQRRRPDPAFAARLETTLMDTFATPHATAALPTPIRPPATNGRFAPASTGRRQRRLPTLPRVRMAPALNRTLQVALVLLLVLASVAGIWLANDRNEEPRIIAPPVATPTVEASPNVPMYRGNPARTGVYPGPGITGTPVELWRTDVTGEIASAPAIVDGVMYFGAGDGGVYALDIATGNQVWTFSGSSAISSSPAVSNGLVYVGSEDGTLYALDTTTGSEVWAVSGARPHSAVAIVDSTLYMGGDDGLYALDAATGATVWTAPLTEAASRSTAVADGVVYIGTVDTMLHTFDAATGEPGWSVQLEGSTVGTTAIVDGVVYQNTFGGAVNHAHALDAATGDVIWQFTSPSSVGFGPAAIGDDLVYFPGHDYSVYALDRATGEPVWSFETGDEVSAAPALVGDTLYVGSLDQTLYALDATTGAEQWRHAVEGGIDFGPVVTGGVAYMGTGFGYMYAIGGSNMLAARSLETPDASPVASPSPATPVATTLGATPAVPTQQVTLLWQSTGGPEPLLAPTSLAVAPDGTLWVVDTANNRFQLFSPDGAYLETWGEAGAGEGQFNFIRSPDDLHNSAGDIAFAPDGSFYVADAANRRVQRFDADRQFVTAWGSFGFGDGQFASPFGIAVAPDGNVYVIDDQRDDIQVFDPQGTYLFTFGGHGTGPGQLNYTGSLAIAPDGSVYVADFDNHRVQQFAADGTFLATIGEAGSGEGQLTSPVDVVVDRFGYLYVTEGEGGRVQVFTRDGEFVMAWTGADDGQGALAFPAGIAVDAEGGVYVADMFASTVQEYMVALPEAAGGMATPVAIPAT